MAQNPFSYEDAFPPEREAGASSQSSFGYEDAFPGAPPPKRSATDYARDVGATAVKGAIAVPEALVGLADIPTGGAVGKFLENEGGAVGFRPKQAKEAVNEWHSDATKEAQRKFQAAEGIGNKAIAAWENPSVVATTIGESIPSMLTGGLAARGILAASKLGQMGVAGARIAGAVGEGVMGAGSAAEQIRQQTDDGLLSPGQMAAAAGTGLATAVFGALGGKVASKLGIGDVDTMIAQGAMKSAGQATAKSVPRQMLEGAISEGLLEELPQSVSEQLLQNLALNKPWDEGMDEAAVLGTLAGMGMGGAASGVSGISARNTPEPQGAAQGTADAAGAAPADSQPQPDIGQPLALPAPVIDVAQDGTARTAADRNARLSRIADGDVTDVTPIPEPAPVDVPPSVAMGIDPAAGPLSAGAAIAVDTGVADQMQQASAMTQAADLAKKTGAASQEQKQPTAKQALSPEEEAGLASSLAGSDLVKGSINGNAVSELQAKLDEVHRRAAENGSWNVPLMVQRKRLEDALGAARQALQAELDAEQAGTVLGAERADAAFASLTEDAGQVPGDLSIPPTTTEGNRNGPQAVQAQQDRTQPPQVGAAPEVARGAPDAQGRAGAAGPQAAAGLTDAAPTSNPGAQAAAAPGAQAAPTAEERAQRLSQAGEAWTRMTTVEREALAQRADLKPLVKKNVHRAAWGDLAGAVQRKLADAMEPARNEQTEPAQQAEPDYEAQVAEMLDPENPRSSVTIAAGHEVPEAIFRAQTNRRSDPGYTMKPGKGGTVVLTSTSKKPGGDSAPTAQAPDMAPDTPAVERNPAAKLKQGASSANTQTVAPAAGKTPKKKPRGILAKKAVAEEKARADYFRPGNVVKGYSGHDRVISYTPADERGNWAVKVQHVVQQGGEWVIDPADPRERTHSTPPDAKELKAGPVDRAQPAQGAADASVQDGQAAVEAPAQQPAEEALSATVSAQDFIPAPDGGLDYGEITPEMGKAMRRQAGKIRLQRGDASFGLVHIEQRHGEEIRKAGFDSVEEFVSGAVADIESIWRPEATSQLVVIQATERGKVVFIQLQAGKDEDGDFYTVKTAFPSSRTYAEKRKEWKQLWSRVPVPAADAGKSAPSAELGNETGSKSTMDSSQSDATSLTQASTAAQPSKPITDFGEKIGGARKDTATTGAKTTKKRSDDDRPAWARRFEISQIAKSSKPSEDGRWVVRDNRTKDWMGQPKQMGHDTFATREEAEAAIPLMAVSQKHRVYADRDEKFAIWRTISDTKRVRVVEQSFDSREDAMRYMAQNAQEIIETNTTFGEADLPRPASATRIGEQQRTSDAKDSDFQEVFGFRGVEFGNWNNQAERQELLNDAYDGLLDLAQVMGIPPKAISLDGELALAFGARGHGLSGSRAHYERDKVVINLTKMNGAGSLAHEWFHAVDHYFARQDGKASAEWVVDKDGTRSLKASSAAESDYVSSGTRGERSGMRAELRAALAQVMQTIAKKAETYVQDTQQADAFVGRARKDVHDALGKLRASLAQSLDYKKRNNQPASAEQLAQFDAIAERIVAGELLDTSLQPVDGARSVMSGLRWTNDALNQISAILKAVRGRNGFDASGNGELDNLRGYMSRYSQRLKMLADAQAGAEKQRAVPTEFVMNAKELDQGRGQDYWTQPHELAARAFQGYVEDKLAEQGGKSPFLNYAPEGAGILTPWGVKRPFPTGAERKAINSAFDNLVSTIQTKETENGVALFSQGLLSPNASGPKPTPEQVQRLVDKVQQVAKQAIPVTVAGSPSDVVGVEVPIGAKPSGALIDGRIYLFSDNLGSIGDAYVTLFHEIFHLGLQRVLPAEDYAAVLRQFARNPLVARYVTQWKDSPEGVQKAATMPSAAYEALANEEALAMVSEALSVDGIGTRPMPGLARRMLSWFADVAERLGLGSNFGNWVRGLTRTDAEKFVSDMTRAVLGGESNLARARAKYGTTAAELTGQNRLSAARDADEFAGVGQNAAPGFNVDSFLATMGRSAAVTKSVSATNRAIMDMAREGQTAQDILRLVAGTSKSRFNRQVARLLLRTGISPTVTLADADLGSGDGFKFLAKYSRKADAVTLTPGAALQAEHIVLHELIHAATLRALDRKGLASLQMRRLFEHVRKQGGATNQYGMKNVGEFVAEVFTNPEFQQVLRQMDAPAGGTLKSAWHSFVRILRSILGLPQDGHDALSRALELGVQVMREDKALRQKAASVGGASKWARDRKFLDGEPVAKMQGDEVPRFGAMSLLVEWAAKHFEAHTTDGAVMHQELGSIKLDRRSAKDSLSHGYGKDKVQALYLLPEVLTKARVLHAESRGEGRMGYVLGAPVQIAGKPFLAAMVVTQHKSRTGLYVHEVVLKEKLQGAINTDIAARAGEAGQPSRDDPGAIRSVLQRLYGVNEAPDDAHFGVADMGALKDGALAQVEQALTHPGKVSVWDKTVGTMRNLAERNPAFKPVYESAQRFIDDVSTLANDAADQAPRLLPRVETLADLKKKPITAADNKAVAKPLFEGTLLWARDLDGTPVTTEALNDKYRNTIPDTKAQILLQTGKIQAQMLRVWQGLPVEQFNAIINNKFESTILKPGVVWTAKELADLFDLTTQQVSLYQEARAAIDRSIDMTARADMLRALGEAYADLREPVLEQATLEDAMKLLTDALQADARENPDGSARVLALNNAVVKSYERAKELQKAGYAPLSRFGRYTVDVVSQDGTREYFGMFETMREANQMAERMRGEFKGANVTQGTMSDEAYKLFQGITPESLEQFGHMLGLDEAGENAKDKAFQAYLQLAKNNHSALKRLIHRKGISGYSEDVGRVLASFVYSNARLAAGGLNAGTLESAIEAIPKEQGELKDVAMGLRSYIQDPQEEGQAVRGMLFAQYLGGSVASAMVNMTQPFQITMPWLSQFGGMRKAAAQMARAVRDVGTRDFKGEPDLTLALQHAVEDGTVAPQEIHQLMAQARGTGSLRTGDGTRMGDARAAAANNWERVKVAWGQPFALAEQFNRRSTFIAAYRMAKEQGMASPSEFARRAVLETQFVYSKANKMRWGRGAIGGTLMTFKTYSVSYLELMHRMWTQGGPEGKRAVGWAVAMLLLMGGAGGLPFMEDAEDLIDGAGQLMGYNVSSQQWRKQMLRDVLGKELADFVEQGVSGLPGAPVDVSGRLGMGNLIPGTGLLMTKQSRERDLMEIAGPAGDLVARGFAGARKALTGDVAGAAMEIAPTAVRNAAKGIDMANSGIYKDTKGYKVIDTTLDEAVAKALGFQPHSVAQVQQSNSFMQRSKSFYVQTSSDIKAQWAKALFEKDDAALQRVRERLAAWNRDNPEQPIVVKMPDVWKKVREMGKDRTARIADTAPKALRLQMREMARENG